METCIGIDEAGRGPALGPLVVALVHWPGDPPPDAPPIRDSKSLRPAQREEAARFIRERARFSVHSIPAWVIARRRESMPALEARVIRDALGHLPRAPVVGDALENGTTTHRWIQRAHPERRIRFEPRADQRIPAVSAASILAKTVRDRAMDRLARRWGELGSGYPSDPTTRAWIDSWGRSGKPWPAFVRTNWSTVDAQPSLLEDV